MLHFVISDALCNKSLSHSVISDALCNDSLSHFVIKLLCRTLWYEICQKSLQNWTVTLCNKIITCILLVTLKIKIYHISTSTRLMATTLDRLYPMITWPYEVLWLIKNDISPLPRGLWLANLTRRRPNTCCLGLELYQLINWLT